MFKKMGLNVGYATAIFNIDLIENAKRLGFSAEEIYNPYLFFLGYEKLTCNALKFDFEGLKVVSLSNNDFKVFENNNLMMYVGFSNSEDVKFINYFINNKNIKREFFHKGNKYLEVIFNHELEKKKVCEIYYDYKGCKVIEKKFLDCGVQLESIAVYYNNITQIFSNEDEFLSFWILEQIIKNHEKIYFYIDRPLRYNNAIFRLINEKIILIGMIHAIHYNHYRSHMVGNLLTGYKQYFDNIQLLDYIVVGTELQKKDIRERFNIDEKVVVIPPSSVKEIKYKQIHKNMIAEFITVGRLAPEKRINHMIEAFNVVLLRGYKFRLSIFGVGPELKSLESLVIKYKLDKYIEFCGYTQDIMLEIEKSDCSLIASCYEGFNISIIESFSCSTPVIAYDVKYGPKALIENDVNGFLVEDGNIVEYAEKIISILENEELKSDMSKSAQFSAVDFLEDKIIEKWNMLVFES